MSERNGTAIAFACGALAGGAAVALAYTANKKGLTVKAGALKEKPDNAPESCPGVHHETAGKASGCSGCPNKRNCASHSGEFPSNAPESCPGTSHDTAGTASGCSGCPNKKSCASIPDNAPESCPGTKHETAGKAEGCSGCPNKKSCASIPDNAPESCPGTKHETAGKAEGCSGCPNKKSCASIPDNAPESCPGTKHETAGRAEGCDGCPNKKSCSGVPDDAPESCPGVHHETAGKAEGCSGCPNQKSCQDRELQEKPDNAPESCPGVSSDKAGKASGCAGCPNQKLCASGEAKKPDPAVADVKSKLANVKRKILVLSGKGGVGKSTVSAQLSFGFAAREMDVGLLDVDICGPSVPRMLGLVGQDVHQSAEGWSPVYVDDHLAVMSIGFMLPNQDDAIIWRGPRKNGLIKQFLTDVNWGAMDALIIDTPPGTSDEHLSIITYLGDANIDGAVIVTTPQEVALMDVRKEINFCKKVGLPVIGVVENMSGYACRTCGHEERIFSPTTGGAEAMCKSMGVPFLGRVPLDGRVAAAGDAGMPISQVQPDGPVAKCIDKVITQIISVTDNKAAAK